MERLRAPLLGHALGFLEGTDTYTMPAQIGLELDEDGLLSRDATVFDAAMLADRESVLEVIGAMADGASDSSYIQFASAHETTTAGAYEVEVDFDGGGNIQIARIREVIALLEELNEAWKTISA